MDTLITPNKLSYKQLRRSLLNHWLRKYELPIEYFVSLPLPTQRFGKPAFVVFVAPAYKKIPDIEGQPIRMNYQAPDRWFLLSAYSGELLLYAFRAIYDFTDVSLPTDLDTDSNKTISEMQDALIQIEATMEQIAPAFFRNEPLGTDTKANLKQALQNFILPQHQPTYTQLAPDFFTWLG